MAEEDENRGSELESPKIVVIGAGISGIAAGNYLAEAGITDFVILEASERIGGRIMSIDLENANGHKAELGANWIHGIDRNPIYKLAVEQGLLVPHFQGRKLGKKLLFVREEGIPVNTKVVEEVDWDYGILMSQIEDFYQMQMPTPVENDSVGAFMEREFEEKISKYPVENRKLRKMIFNQRMINESMISGCDSMYDVALSEVGSFEELPGVHYVIPPGFEAVVHLLSKNIPKEKLLLEHPVSRVNWSQEGNGNSEICVECQNGKRFYANHVLVTISLGCLKNSAKRMFNPSLPDSKLNAIKRLTIGTVNKVVLEYESGPILPEEVFRLELIWDRENLEQQDIKDRWFKKISFFEAIEKNAVVAWLCGKEAEYMETLTEQEVGQQLTHILKAFLRRSDIPPLKKVTMSRWKSNPYTLGSYSFIPVGASAEDIELLGEPVTDQNEKPVLLFAGEATHSSFYSSAHGAMLSGHREAQRILDFYAQ